MPTPQVHLIVGDDEFRVAQHAKELVETLVPEADRTLALEMFDGRVEGADAAIAVIRQATEAVQTQSFLGGAKTVWIKEITFLGGQRLGDAKSLKPAVEYLRKVLREGIPEGHTLVLSGSGIPRNSGIALDAAKLAKDGRAQVHSFEAPSRWNADRDATSLLAKDAAAAGHKLPPGLSEQIVARVGPDTRRLASELEKLLLYAGDRAPTSEDVTAVVTPSRTGETWDLLDAFGERRTVQTITLLRRLVDVGVSPVQLVIQLVSRVNDLLLVRDIQDRRQARIGGRSFQWAEGLSATTSEAVADLGKRFDPALKNSYVLGKLLEQSRKFRRIELRKARHLLIAAHEQMVSIQVPPEALLELAVLNSLA